MTDEPPRADDDSTSHAPPSSSEKRWAVAAHLSALSSILTGIGAIAGPLAVWLMGRRRSPFIDGHARQALDFGIAITATALLVYLVMLLLFGFGLQASRPLLVVLWIVLLLFVTRASIKAARGRTYHYPLAVRLVSTSPRDGPPEDKESVGPATQRATGRLVLHQGVGFLIVFLAFSIISFGVMVSMTYFLFPPMIFIMLEVHDLGMDPFVILMALLYHSFQVATLVTFSVFMKAGVWSKAGRGGKGWVSRMALLSTKHQRIVTVAASTGVLLMNELVFFMLYRVSLVAFWSRMFSRDLGFIIPLWV